MILSVDERRAIQQGEAVSVTVDGIECVLIRKDLYQKIAQQEYEDSDVEITQAYPLMDEAAQRAGWDDPSEDLYDDLKPADEFP